MGYRTVNEESHICEYCDNIVKGGQGILLKYSSAQSDASITESRLTYRVGHEQCIKQYGSTSEQQALKPAF